MNVALPKTTVQQAVQLRLFVTGNTVSAQRAQKALEELASTLGPDRFDIQVFDVLSNPEAALRNKVFATPTVIRSLNGDEHRLVGDFSSPEKLEAGLRLNET